MDTERESERYTQVVTVKEFSIVSGLTVDQVHYKIKEGKIGAIRSGHNGSIRIPKHYLREYGFNPIGVLDTPPTLLADVAAGYLGFSGYSLRRFLAENPGAIISFPLGRSFGVTTESIARLLGFPISLWPELPEPSAEIETPANGLVAVQVIPEIRRVIQSMHEALRVIENWLTPLEEMTEPITPEYVQSVLMAEDNPEGL